MAKDHTPRARRGARAGAQQSSRSGGDRQRPASARGAAVGRGRTKPPTQVVTQQRRPWGLIAAALAVVVFAATVITYAVVTVNQANADKVTSTDQIEGIETFEYARGQGHVPTPVDYPESPPVGGEHDGVWADCTGTVYSVDIRNENAVHSLEHGATWITYDPDRVDQQGVDALGAIVTDTTGTMLSPRPGLDAAVSLQSWNNQLTVDSATDPRIEQFVEFLTFNADSTPELGATCENPDFTVNPQLNADTGVPGTPTAPAPAPATGDGSGAPGSETP